MKAVHLNLPKRVLVLVPVLLLPFARQEAAAQYIKRWLDVGSYQHWYSEAGANSEDQRGSTWPAILGSNADLHHSDALWVAVTDWTDEAGKTWPHKIAHKGPRVMGFGELWTYGMTMMAQFDDPEVYVDGLLTFGHPATVDEVNGEMNPTRMLVHSANFLNGISMERRVLAFDNEYHDNYHVMEYVFQNTGNIDGDEGIEFPDRTLTGVYFYFSKRWGISREASGVLANGAKWGRENLFDAVWEGIEDADVDFRADFGWSGNDPDFTRWDPMGAPAITDNGWYTAEGDSVGRLTGFQFAGTAVLHADGEAHEPSVALDDDPAQPSTMVWYSSDDDVLDYGQTAFNEKQQAAEYDLIASGRKYPGHADFIDPDGDFAHPPYGPDPTLDTPGGHKQGMGFGPYTMAPSEVVRIVIARGASGLSLDAAVQIGKQYKQLWRAGDDFGDIEYDADGDGVIEDDEIMDKNEWILTGRDSLFQTFRRAIANYESGYDIPQPPLPPSQFRVISGIDAIRLEWDPYPDATPTAWEIYRTQNLFQGNIQNDRKYELIATLAPGENVYEDEDVQRGVSYYYYIQAVGEVNQDPTGNTPTGVRLKSNRYWTQSYDPAILKRAPGSELEAARIVPNPYNLSSDQNIRWPDQQDKIGFLNIPGQATITIYTERGDRIETIEHTDGSGDAYWDLTTSANQLVVSGLYLAIIRDNDTGEQLIRKFVIIR